MTIKECITDMEDRHQRLEKEIALYKQMEQIFADIEFPPGIHAHFFSYSDSEIYCEFRPSYNSEVKDINPLVHKLAQKFNVKFTKNPGYTGDNLEYHAKVDSQPKLSIHVCGVVPASCHIEITEEPLTEAEILLARQKALEDVKTVRIKRKIVCQDFDE